MEQSDLLFSGAIYASEKDKSFYLYYLSQLAQALAELLTSSKSQISRINTSVKQVLIR